LKGLNFGYMTSPDGSVRKDIIVKYPKHSKVAGTLMAACFIGIGLLMPKLMKDMFELGATATKKEFRDAFIATGGEVE